MYYKELHVTGVENTTTYDEGLVSTEIEPKRITAILINVSVHEGNVIEGWIGTNRIMAVYDYVFNTIECSAANVSPFATNRIGRLPIEQDIKPGQTFKIAIRCGIDFSVIHGAYEYEITA